MSGERLADALLRVRKALAEAGIDDPAREARLLVMAALDFSASDLILGEGQALDPDQASGIDAFLARRGQREPLSRIVGKRGFYGLEFKISPAVLDPRPETEHLVEAALEHIRSKEAADILDIGTGSGAILLAVLHACPAVRGGGVDISDEALDIARENARRLGLESRAAFQISDVFSGVSGRFDVILSNPPYIPETEAFSLAPEVRDHDPSLALFAEGDGLIFYRRILEKAHEHLNPDGLLGVEVGHDQARRVVQLLRQAGFHSVRTIMDYAGHERCVFGIHA